MINHKSWYNQQTHLIPFSIYSFLRIISGNGIDLGLRKDLSTFCSSILTDKFKECSVIGRDLIRILQDISKMPEFTSIWNFLYQTSINDSSFESSQLYKILQIPTPKRYLATRMTPDMETNLLFILDNVKYGGSHHRKYYDWFLSEYLKVNDPDNLIIDIIRYLVVSYHPPNSILASSSVQRWQIITWFLRQMKTNHSTANAKLALFYDWLFYDPAIDNIMNVEPAILIISKSSSANPKISSTMIEFLYILKKDYLPMLRGSIERCIDKTMFDILSKRVISNLESILLSDQISDEIKMETKELFPCYTNLNSLKQTGLYNSTPTSELIKRLSISKSIEKIERSFRETNNKQILEISKSFVQELGMISDAEYEEYESSIIELIRDKFNCFQSGQYEEWANGLRSAFNEKDLDKDTIDQAIERLSLLPISDFNIETFLIHSPPSKSNESINSFTDTDIIADYEDDPMENGIEDQVRFAKSSDSKQFYLNCFNQFYSKLSESPKINELLGLILEDSDPSQVLHLKNQILIGQKNPLIQNWSNLINSLHVTKDWDGYCQIFLWDLLLICFKQVPNVLKSFRELLRNLKPVISDENSEICNGLINLAISLYPKSTLPTTNATTTAMTSNLIANEQFNWILMFLEEGPCFPIISCTILTFYWRSNSRSFLQSLVKLDDEDCAGNVKKLQVKETLIQFSKSISGLEENSPAKKSLLSCIDTTIALMNK